MSDFNFDQAWVAFDPLAPVPPDDPKHWFVELSDARNDRHFRTKIAQQLRRDTGRPLRTLLMGHPGTGKSTELARLRFELERDGYVVAVAEIDRDLDKKDVELVEVQLLLIERVGEALEKRKLKLTDSLLNRLKAWFHEEETVTDMAGGASAEIGVGVEPGESLMGKLFSVVLPRARADGRVSVERRKTVRARAARKLREFVELTAEIIGEAVGLVQQDDARGLVLIIDGLEKVTPDAPGSSRAARLLLDGSEQWAQIPAPLIFTAPLDLLVENQRLENHVYEKWVISAIPVFGRPDQPAEPMPDYVKRGREGLRKLVERRAPVGDLFASEVDFERVLDCCGGSIRDLFRLLRKAIDESSPGKAIDTAATDRALRYFAEDMQLALRPGDYELLAALLAMPEGLHYDAAGVSLLQRELVLPYVNGGRWFGVHPAIRGRIPVR